MSERAFRCIDRKVGEIRAAQPFQLGIEIGKVASLQQRVIGKINAGGHVLRHERNLFGLGEEIIRHAIQDQSPHGDRLEDLFGNNLGGVEDVEIEAVRKVLIEELYGKFPFREVAGLDRLPQVAAMEIRIGAIDFDRFVPDYRLHAKLWFPDEFDKGGFVVRVDEAEGVDAEALHEAEGARDRTI